MADKIRVEERRVKINLGWPGQYKEVVFVPKGSYRVKREIPGLGKLIIVKQTRWTNTYTLIRHEA